MGKRWAIEDLERLHNKGITFNVDAIPQLKPEHALALYGDQGVYFEPQHTNTIVLPIRPLPKPRMVKSDAWKKRPVVEKYWRWKDKLNLIAKQVGLTSLPESDFHVIFWMPMPPSWKKKIRAEMDGTPHKNKPDGDNLMKALQDCLCESDQHIWDFRVTKRWATEGKIEIKTY